MKLETRVSDLKETSKVQERVVMGPGLGGDISLEIWRMTKSMPGRENGTCKGSGVQVSLAMGGRGGRESRLKSLGGNRQMLILF